MNCISIQYYKSPFGELLLGAYQDELCLCDWRYRKMRSTIDHRICKGLNSEYKIEENETIRETIKQLNEYFSKQRTEFDIPIRLVGSPFQVKVWTALMNIPYGDTETYLGLAQRIDHPDAIRAVATANGANSISLIVPCHRVIGSQGEMTGYAGGIQTKKKLLELEAPDRFRKQLELF
jgi:methylated-DNA-[protein]-cysteine S-methyltransferase